MAQGLGVRHHGPASAYPARDWFGTVDNLWPSASRPASSARTRRRTDSDGAHTPMLHRKSASNLLDRSHEPFVSHTAHNRSASNLLDGGKLQQRSAAQSQTRSQEIAELVDFLNNYKPPVESWTSQPFDNEGRGRWSRLKNMGGLVKRSKSVPKMKRQIRLPDSAVCGTTTGGHRHIAISIPMEASPFGLMPRSQYPVYQHSAANHLLEPAGPVRYVNEKGVITVVRPSTENSYSHNSKGSFPGFRLSIPPSPGPPPVKALPPTGFGLSRSKSNATSRDSVRLSPPEVEKVPRQIESRPDLQNINSVASSLPRRTSSAQGSYPLKASKALHRASIARPSIDGIIANNSTKLGDSTPTKKQRPTSESSAVDCEESTLGGGERWSHSRQTSTHVVQIPAGREESQTKSNGPVLISENPLATMDEHETPPATPGTAGHRRDKVRYLKQRDMASVRTSVRQQDSGRSTQQDPPTVQTKGPAQSNRYMINNTFSPIMVVTSIEPTVDALPARPMWDNRKRRDLEITPPERGFVSKVDRKTSTGDRQLGDKGEAERMKSLTIPQARRARARASLSPLTARKPCNPTPPMSPSRTPRRANSALDRTSLSRRREWNTTKCKARRVQEVVDAAKSRMQDDTKLIEALKEVQAADRDQEFLKLYEAYREHRLRDMERRVRRLERHGDVWMRALVPVLDNLNRTMISGQHGLRDDRMYEQKSDDEAAESPSRGRTKHRSLPVYTNTVRRTASAERCGGLAPKDGDEEQDDSPRDSDESGLENLEPLMRELAGAAQERLKRSEKLTGIAL